MKTLKLTRTKQTKTQRAAESPKKRLTKLTLKAGLQLRTAAGKWHWQRKFLTALAQMPHVAAACRAAHISRQAAYKAKDNSRRFARQWEDACATGIGKLEAYAWRRATIGTKRGVWMKDKDGNPVKVDEVTEFSDGLAMLLLKAHWPEKYREPRESTSATATLPDGGTLSMTVVHSPIDPEQVTGPAPQKP